jgi:hypothetical protein
MQNHQALFDKLCTRRLEKAAKICAERGGQYGDTWGECPWLVLKSVFGKLFPDIEIDLPELRALGAAVFVDLKHQRFMGSFKVDNLDDGINYNAVLAEMMESPELLQCIANRTQTQEEAEALRS